MSIFFAESLLKFDLICANDISYVIFCCCCFVSFVGRLNLAQFKHIQVTSSRKKNRLFFCSLFHSIWWWLICVATALIRLPTNEWVSDIQTRLSLSLYIWLLSIVLGDRMTDCRWNMLNWRLRYLPMSSMVFTILRILFFVYSHLLRIDWLARRVNQNFYP